MSADQGRSRLCPHCGKIKDHLRDCPNNSGVRQEPEGRSQSHDAHLWPTDEDGQRYHSSACWCWRRRLDPDNGLLIDTSDNASRCTGDDSCGVASHWTDPASSGPHRGANDASR